MCVQFIKAAGISSAQLITLTQPFGGRLPTNEGELEHMFNQIRRTWHILEGSPGNLGSLLHGPPRQAHRRAYVAHAIEQSENPTNPNFLTYKAHNPHEFDGWSIGDSIG